MSLPDFFQKGHGKVRGRRVAKLSANGTLVLPKGIMLDQVYFRNRTANAVTGGIRVGTSAAGTQVVTAQAVAANAVARVNPTIPAYTAGADTTLYVEAVTSWNGAVVDVLVEYTEVTTRTEPSDNTIQGDLYK